MLLNIAIDQWNQTQTPVLWLLHSDAIRHVIYYYQIKALVSMPKTLC